MITPYAPYRLSYLLPIIFALITLHQALSKSDEETLTNNDHRADEKQPTTSNQTSTRHRNIREESGLQKAKELKEKYEAE